jgi:hypothetical protein
MQYDSSVWSLSPAARSKLAVGVLCLFVAAASIALIALQTLSQPDDLTWNRWAFYEWLINYESGFVRRGAVGELIQRWFHGAETEALNHLVFGLGTAFIALSTMQVLRPENLSVGAVLYMLSPAGFLWLAVANQYYYRKEMLFYVAILAVAALYRKRTEGGSAGIDRLIVASVLGCALLLPFVHEACVFFCGLFFTLVLRNVLADHLPPRQVRHALIAFVALNLGLFAVLGAFKSPLADSLTIWRSLSPHARSFAGGEVSGAVMALGWSAFYAALMPVKILLSGLATFYLFALLLLYVISAYIYAELAGGRLREALRDRVFRLNFALVSVTFLPLFLIGEDWGRWIFGIFTVFMAMLYSRLLVPIDAQWVARWQARLRLSSLKSQRGRLLFAGLLLLALTTRLPECCLSGSGGAFVRNLAIKAKAVLQVPSRHPKDDH